MNQAVVMAKLLSDAVAVLLSNLSFKVCCANINLQVLYLGLIGEPELSQGPVVPLQCFLRYSTKLHAHMT